MTITKITQIFTTCFLAVSFATFAQYNFPGKNWQVYKEPMQAGWNSGKLAGIKRYSDSIGIAAMMIVHKGVIVDYKGDIERKYLCHSMRKSFLSALYGMYTHKRTIDINNTLEQLNIDDTVHPLTKAEKQATVKELLQARSGIYLPAAYEGDPQKPERGSHPHGTYWLYNNWDFNALGTILEQNTKTRFFENLQTQIAAPLEMEDIDSLDVFYDYEPKRSQHPAYTFRMSTRDLARFGLLYACGGRWKDKRLLPESWIKESTTAYSCDDDGNGYGYLWWIDQTVFKARGMFHAAGMGGHHIFIFPKDSLVVVVRTDTYNGKSAQLKDEYKLLSLILSAKEGAGMANPELEALRMVKEIPASHGNTDPNRYIGLYQFEGEWMDIFKGKKELILDTELMGKFYLEQIDDSLFRLKDQQNYVSFIFDENGKAIRLIYHDKSISSSIKK